MTSEHREEYVGMESSYISAHSLLNISKNSVNIFDRLWQPRVKTFIWISILYIYTENLV